MYGTNTASFTTPFRSGCGMCKPSTDYYNVNRQTGGSGNYSKDGLIPQSDGKNLFKTPNFNVSQEQITKNNLGIEYATAFGGAKSKKAKKSTKKSVKKTISKKKSQKKTTRKMKGGNNEMIPQEEHMMHQDKNLLALDKDLITLNKDVIQHNVDVLKMNHNDLSTHMSGGKKKSMRKKMKGGLQLEEHNNTGRDDKSFSSLEYTSTKSSEIIGGAKKSVKKTSLKKKPVKKSLKKPKRKMRGGQETEGATGLPLRYFNPNLPPLNAPSDSGKGVMSAYGPVEPNDIGVGMLAPYTSSTSPTANPNTMMKTGGAKKSKGKKIVKKPVKKTVKKTKKSPKRKMRKMRGGQETEGATGLPLRFYNPTGKIDNFPANSGEGIMSAYGPIKLGDVGTGMLAPYTASTSSTANPNTMMKTGGAKKSKGKKLPKKPMKKSTKKTKKSTKKSTKKMGGAKIPYIGDGSVNSVQNGINNAVSKFSSYLQTLDNDYVKSTEYLKNLKIGNERLIQGGKKTTKVVKKTKKSTKKTTKPKTKKIVKKSTKKTTKPKTKKTTKPKTKKITKKLTKTRKMKKGGFDGSDFASTLNSRGPANAPDDYWGVDGKTWFRQFNKTGEYIPNSQLPYAATPELAGSSNNGVVTGYEERIINHGNSNNI